ncbi:hypothetical protein A0H81_07411 [Grifola frondosa]|uniref:Uncharacterized protein n=1 Tax=Grifola frondosa TaxID=5627 RepID=A0A1C7M7X0_GRIFR|nr:hypothetical protein A0H81_07411 [Grifola frondosa]
MKTRYPIRTENFSATAPWDQDQVPVNVNYPVWGRACNASRADANASDREKAGIPDFVLFMDPKADRNVCIGEGKAFWSFSHTDFADFVMDTAYNGFFDWGDDRSDKAFYAVKQVWGELIYYNSSWGFITNGKELVILVKTGEYELAVTPVHDICDDTLYKALIGLCFASIDGRKADGSDSIDLITRLCGPLTAPPPAPPGAVVKDDEDTDISVDSDDSKDETYNPNDHPSDDSMSDH